MPVSFPAGTTVGELYTEGGVTWRWNGTGWAIVSADKLFASATPPSEPIDGNTWYDMNTGRLYFYMGGAWVQAKTAVSI
jgi:hypothetical protein